MSSLRTQGPITTGVRYCKERLSYRETDRLRGMGPRVRGDDARIDLRQHGKN
jgi:hypothetical protein